MRFERREHRSFALVIATPVLAILCALALAGLLIAIAGAPVMEAYWRIRRGLRLAAFGDRDLNPRKPAHSNRPCRSGRFPREALEHRRRGSVLSRSDCRRRRQFAPFRRPPPPLQVPLLLVAGAAAGIVLLLVPLWLRLRFSVDEVVTTLLLNFVAVLFVSMLIDGPLKDPMGFGWPQSQPVADAAVLPKLFARSRLHVGLMIALVLAVAVHLVQSRTVFGMQSRAAGLNPAGAVFAGVPLGRTLVTVACISGGLAGLAGAIEVMGVQGYVTTDLSPGYGYSGIVVAMLANLHPLGVVLAALFTAVMFVGADGMSRSMGIPSYIADVTVALSLISMLTGVFFTQYRIRR